VGAAHAGWRGLAGEGGRGVLETFFQSFWHDPIVEWSHAATKKRADDTLAWLGPCIGPDAFEVGAEVREAFCKADRGAEGFFRAIGGGKYLADLPGLARHRLLKLGVTAIYGNDGSGDWCTVGNPHRYFSHRRDAVTRGGSGRLAACVWRKP
jgi:copper oxidase (laccase) domain-containing protein